MAAVACKPKWDCYRCKKRTADARDANSHTQAMANGASPYEAETQLTVPTNAAIKVGGSTAKGALCVGSSALLPDRVSCEAEHNAPGPTIMKEDLTDGCLGRSVKVFRCLPGTKGPGRGEWLDALVSGFNMRRNSLKVVLSVSSETTELDISKECVVWLAEPPRTDKTSPYEHPPESVRSLKVKGSVLACDAKLMTEQKTPNPKSQANQAVLPPTTIAKVNTAALCVCIVLFLAPFRLDSGFATACPCLPEISMPVRCRQLGRDMCTSAR